MRNLKIEFHKSKCTGAFQCTTIAPAFFQKQGKVATLRTEAVVDGHQTQVVSCDDATAAQLITAAEKCPSNVITIIDLASNEKIVDTSINVSLGIREIQAQYDDMKEFVLDEKGYFLIRIVPEKKLIEVGFCGKRNTVEIKVFGKTPIEMYQTILREKIIERADHAAYLGRELQKAYTALQLGIAYVQDDDLDFSKISK